MTLWVIFPRSPRLIATPEEHQQADDLTKMLPAGPRQLFTRFAPHVAPFTSGGPVPKTGVSKRSNLRFKDRSRDAHYRAPRALDTRTRRRGRLPKSRPPSARYG